MRKKEEIRKSFSEQNKMVFQKTPDNDSDDEQILSTPDIQSDDILSKYLNDLRQLSFAYQTFNTPVTVQQLKNIKKSSFKQLDARAFERNVNDNAKNIFFYLTYVNFDSELVIFFTELCKEADQLNLSRKPLWHELGKYESHQLTPLEHALFRNKVRYAFLIAEQMLSDYDIETLKFVVNRTTRKDLATESEYYIENCKKLNYLVLCLLLFNFKYYSIPNRDYIVDCITTLINDGRVSTDDSYNYIQQIETCKKTAYSENKNYILLPLLHRIATLANIDPTRCGKILKSITKEKLAELNKEVIKGNGDTALLSFAFYIKNTTAIEVFKTLLILLDPTARSPYKGSNIFHKLLRNPNLDIVPDILDMMFTSLDSNLLKNLWLSPDKENCLPFEELIPGKTKTPKRVTSREDISLQEIQLTTLPEPDYSAAIPSIRRIVSLWPELCKVPLGANNETLLMHAIKNKSLRKIIPEIILKSDREHTNKQNQNAEQMAVSLGIELDEFIQKANAQKDQDHSYYKTRKEFEDVCNQRDDYRKDAEKYRNQRDEYQDDFKKSQKELSELNKEHVELKRKYTQLSTQNETSEKNLQRIRQARDDLEKEIEKLKLDINSKNKKLSQEEKSSKEYKGKFEKISAEKDRLFKDLEKAKAKLYEIENQYTELKEQFSNDEKNQEWSELMSTTVAQYQKQAETKTKESTKLTEEVNLLKQQKHQLESANDQLKVTLENRENELESYKETQEKLTASNKVLENTKQQNLSLQQQLEQLQKRYDELSNKQRSTDAANLDTEAAPTMQPFSFPLGFNSPIGKTSSASTFGQYPSNVFHSFDKKKRKYDDENNLSEEEEDSNKKKLKKNDDPEDLIQKLLENPLLENFLTQEPTLELEEETTGETSNQKENTAEKSDADKQKNPQKPQPMLQDGKFVPQFFPKNLKFNKKNLTTVSSSAKKPIPAKPVKANSVPPKKKRKKFPQQTAYAIGRCGELSAYQILKDYYIQRYDETCPPVDDKKTDKYRITTEENATGFVLKGFDKDDKLAVTIEIIWHNKNMPEDTDSGQHHDMQIRRTGGKGNKERYIEIKSTTKNYKTQVKLTGQEWLELMQHKHNFRLYRVFLDTDPRIEKYKMYEDLLQGNLPVNAIKLSL